MKPFGKWLADFELPPKDEPQATEPQVEVIDSSPIFAVSEISWDHPRPTIYFQDECKPNFTEAHRAALRESLAQVEMAARNRRMRIEEYQRHE